MAQKSTSFIQATGRRKSAVARIRFQTSKKNTIQINKKSFKDYLPTLLLQEAVEAPLKKLENVAYDIHVNVKGGGIKGQAEAIQHGIARALCLLDPNHKKVLKAYVGRDPRRVERKKPGQAGARKKFQFTKR